jgi:hypothetical protein
LKFRSSQLGVGDFFPTQLIIEKPLWKPCHASLKSGSCSATLSWCLALVEIIIEALKVKPEITMLPPAFWLGVASLPGKSQCMPGMSFPTARSWRTPLATSSTAHLQLDLVSWVIVLPASQWVHLPSGDNQEHLPSSLVY